MAINRSLINRIEKVIEAAEAVLGRADQPLTLGAIVLDDDDEGEAKARALGAYIAAPQRIPAARSNGRFSVSPS